MFEHDPHRRLVQSDLAVVFFDPGLDGATVFPICSLPGDLGPRSFTME